MSRNDPYQPMEVHLLKLPLERLVEALEAIDDPDMHILKMHEDKGDATAAKNWREEVSRRRIGRQQFLEFRLQAEVIPFRGYRGIDNEG